MREINIKFIPHAEQRYVTVGDYWKDYNGNLQIRVSCLDNEDMENLIAVHELNEALLVYKRGISEEEITKFDIDFDEANREGEPGDALDSPYRKEHFFATLAERLLCRELEVNWTEYDNTIINLFEVK